MVTSLTNER